MDSARRLIEQESLVSLTSAAIAQDSGVSSATFYVYFANVEAIIHALSVETTADAQCIVEAIRKPGASRSARASAERFVAAYQEYWLRHRPVLSIRNMEADRGNKAFQFMRQEVIQSMMGALMDLALSIRRMPLKESEERLYARIGVVVAAIERLAAVGDLYEQGAGYPAMCKDDLLAAQVDILAVTLDPSIVYKAFRRYLDTSKQPGGF